MGNNTRKFGSDLGFGRDLISEQNYQESGWKWFGMSVDLSEKHEKVTTALAEFQASGKFLIFDVGGTLNAIPGQRNLSVDGQVFGKGIDIDGRKLVSGDWPIGLIDDPLSFGAGFNSGDRGLYIEWQLENVDGRFTVTEVRTLINDVYTSTSTFPFKMPFLDPLSFQSDDVYDLVGDAAAELQAEFPYLSDKRAREIVEDAKLQHKNSTRWTPQEIDPNEAVELYVDRNSLISNQQIANKFARDESQFDAGLSAGKQDRSWKPAEIEDVSTSLSTSGSSKSADDKARERREDRSDKKRNDKKNADKSNTDASQSKKIVDYSYNENTKTTTTTAADGSSRNHNSRHGLQQPIVFDLDNDGVQITELTQSTNFIDAFRDRSIQCIGKTRRWLS